MKNTISLIICCLVILIISSCATIEKTEYFPFGGPVKRKYYLHKNVIHGKDTVFFSNGTVKEIRNWKNGFPIDTLKMFSKNGKLIRTGLFKLDTLTLSDTLNRTMRIGRYTPDGFTGEVFDFNQNGDIKARGHFLNGKYHGLVITYYDNNKVKIIMPFKNGESDGVIQTFHENGMTKSIYKKENGKKYDFEYTYYTSGQLRTKKIYDNKGNLKDKAYYDYNGNKLEGKSYSFMKDPGLPQRDTKKHSSSNNPKDFGILTKEDMGKIGEEIRWQQEFKNNYRTIAYSGYREETIEKIKSGFVDELTKLTGVNDEKKIERSHKSYLRLLKVVSDIRGRNWEIEKKKEKHITATKVHYSEMEKILGESMFKSWGIKKKEIDKEWHEQLEKYKKLSPATRTKK